jgi:hypothetical protein
MLAVALVTASCAMGCDLLKYALSDVSGWDVSACVDGFETCIELFTDNQDRILGGRSAVDVLLGQ